MSPYRKQAADGFPSVSNTRLLSDAAWTASESNSSRKSAFVVLGMVSHWLGLAAHFGLMAPECSNRDPGRHRLRPGSDRGAVQPLDRGAAHSVFRALLMFASVTSQGAELFGSSGVSMANGVRHTF